MFKRPVPAILVAIVFSLSLFLSLAISVNIHPRMDVLVPFPAFLFIGAAIFAVFGWVILIPTLCLATVQVWTDGNTVIKEIKSTFLTQEIVDARLHEIAKKFDKECREQIALQGTDAAEVQLEQSRLRIDSLKSQFWKAHALVVQLGYKTKRSVRGYFTLPVTYSIAD